MTPQRCGMSKHASLATILHADDERNQLALAQTERACRIAYHRIAQGGYSGENCRLVCEHALLISYIADLL